MENELFGKVKNDVYFELLRLAKASDVDFFDQNLIKAKESIYQLHLNYESHKRLIALIKNKANQLNVFDNLDEDIKYLLNTETQKHRNTTYNYKRVGKLTSVKPNYKYFDQVEGSYYIAQRCCICQNII